MTAAVGGLLGVAVLSLAGAATSAVFAAGDDAGRRRDLSVGGETWTGIEDSVRIATDIAVALGIGVALVLLALAVLTLRGSNAARVATGVLAGPYLGWALCGIAVDAGVVGFYPGWVRVVLLVAQITAAVLYVAVVVLLALPPSNAFFRPTVAERADGVERSDPVVSGRR